MLNINRAESAPESYAGGKDQNLDVLMFDVYASKAQSIDDTIRTDIAEDKEKVEELRRINEQITELRAQKAAGTAPDDVDAQLARLRGDVEYLNSMNQIRMVSLQGNMYKRQNCWELLSSFFSKYWKNIDFITSLIGR